MTLLQHALEYAKQGFHIFPCFYVKKEGGCSCNRIDCKRIGKHPIPKAGVKAASRDPRTINAWWKRTPFANIAVATGHDGLFVVDVDVSGDKPGKESLDRLTDQFGPLPDTLQQITGSGGAHYFFCSTLDIHNSTDRIGKAIDVRGKGGYVILPPSNHSSGNKYKWIDKKTKIIDSPKWITDLTAVDARQDTAIKFKDEDLTKKHKKFTPAETQLVLKHIDSDDREIWFRVGSALLTEYGEKIGYKIWDEWSSDSPKYNAEVGVQQWRSMRAGQITMGTIVSYAQEGGWRGFDQEAADKPEIKQNWIWVASIKRFIYLPTFQEYDAEQFSGLFAPMFKRGKASDHCLRNHEFPRVEGKTYWPLQEKIVMEEGTKKLNCWRPCTIEPVDGNVQPFLDHVTYIFPEVKEQNILLDYLAFQVQHPGIKIHWAILIQGPSGNGKSFFAKAVMRNILGAHNIKFLHCDTLHEPYTGWQKDCQLVVVEEVMARGRLEVMNKLKPIITEPWTMIREMYKPPYEQRNRFNFLMMTNHPDALILDEGDRRYCVLSAEAPPQPHEYYAGLFEWADDNAGPLLHWFQQRDLSAFQPKAHAPTTEGKQVMIEESRPPLDEWIMQQVAGEDWPFGVDLILPSDIASVLGQFGLRGTPKDVGRSFSRLQYMFLGKRSLGSRQGRLWAIRNGKDYENLDSGQVRAAWIAQVNEGIRGESSNAPSDQQLISRRNINVVKQTKPM